MDAEIFGNFIRFASGVFTKCPKIARSFDRFWLLQRVSGKEEIMRPAKEISFVPILMPAAAEKVLMIGKRDILASSGASSTIV